MFTSPPSIARPPGGAPSSARSYARRRWSSFASCLCPHRHRPLRLHCKDRAVSLASLFHEEIEVSSSAPPCPNGDQEMERGSSAPSWPSPASVPAPCSVAHASFFSFLLPRRATTSLQIHNNAVDLYRKQQLIPGNHPVYTSNQLAQLQLAFSFFLVSNLIRKKHRCVPLVRTHTELELGHGVLQHRSQCVLLALPPTVGTRSRVTGRSGTPPSARIEGTGASRIWRGYSLSGMDLSLVFCNQTLDEMGERLPQDQRGRSNWLCVCSDWWVFVVTLRIVMILMVVVYEWHKIYIMVTFDKKKIQRSLDKWSSSTVTFAP